MDHKRLKIERRTKKKNIQNKMDIVGELHPDLAHQILKLLDLKDWASCWYTCRRWRDLIGDDYFWKFVCKQNNFMEDKIFLKSGVARKEEYWQSVYNYYAATNISWRSGHFEEVNYFQYNFSNVIYLDDEIVVGCVKLFNSIIRLIIINHLERKVKATFDQRGYAHSSANIAKVCRYKDFLFTYVHVYETDYNYVGAPKMTIINLKDNTRRNMNDNSLFASYSMKQMIVCENFIAGVAARRCILEVYNMDTDLVEYKCPDADVKSYGFTNGKLAILKNNAVKVVNLKDFSECMLIPCKKIVLVKTVLASNSLILSICSTGHVCCWCAKTENELQHFSITFDDDYEGVLSLYNEKLVYYNIESGSTEVWNVLTGNRQFVIKKLFYMISCNSRYMVGVDVGEQRVDVRCFESGELLVDHINGMNLSELHSSNIIRLFSVFLKLRKEYNRPNRERRKMHLLLTSMPAIQITETCLAITKVAKPSKLSKLNFFKKHEGPEMGITMYHIKF